MRVQFSVLGDVVAYGWRHQRCDTRNANHNSAAVLQAAIDGHGIALARSVMAADDFATGRLVRLFPAISCKSPLDYYVVYRAECSSLPKLSAFRDWLFEEAAST